MKLVPSHQCMKFGCHCMRKNSQNWRMFAKVKSCSKILPGIQSVAKLHSENVCGRHICTISKICSKENSVKVSI
jgi:hypothetical protein